MVRIEGTDTRYIEKLLDEMETDKNNTYVITINEIRNNSEISSLEIKANFIEPMEF